MLITLENTEWTALGVDDGTQVALQAISPFNGTFLLSKSGSPESLKDGLICSSTRVCKFKSNGSEKIRVASNCDVPMTFVLEEI